MNLLILSLMLSGAALGYLLRRRPLPFLSRLVSLLVWLLLFLLGLEVGGNPSVLTSLPTLGLQALCLSLGALLGSACCAWLLWRMVRRVHGVPSSAVDGPAAEGHPLRGSLLIMAFFLAGALLGVAGCSPSPLVVGRCSMVALFLLMGSVGVSVGHDSALFSSFRQLSPRLLLLPLFTLCGTLLGAVLVWALVPGGDLRGSLAVASGLGYYSLSSIFLTELRGAEWGTVALLANVVREVVALTCAPFLCRLFGPLAPISAGGATTMDTTLPVIVATSGRLFLPLSVFHGACLDASVPFLVTAFAS